MDNNTNVYMSGTSPKKTSSLKIAAIIVLLAALLAGGWYGYSYMKNRKATPQKEAEYTGEADSMRPFGDISSFPYEAKAEINDMNIVQSASSTIYIRKYDSTNDINNNVIMFIRYFTDNGWLSSFGTSKEKTDTVAIQALKGSEEMDITVSKGRNDPYKSYISISLTTGMDLSKFKK